MHHAAKISHNCIRYTSILRNIFPEARFLTWNINKETNKNTKQQQQHDN